MLKTLVPLVLFLLAAKGAAQDLIAVAWDGNVYRIDSRTGGGAWIGTTGFGHGLGIGHNAATTAGGRILVAYSDTVSTVRLLDIDPVTGAGTPVGAPIVLDVRGMATSPTGTVYALVNGAPDLLYTIDVASSTASRVGPTGFSALQALAFHDGVLYGWDFVFGLVTIDPSTGAATDVNPAVGNPPQGPLQFLASDPCGRLLGGTAELQLVDPTTGVATLIGSGVYTDVRGAEFYPGGVAYGAGCAGSNTVVPVLSVLGLPTSPGTLHLCLSRAAPSAPFVWVFGLARAAIPVFGCTLNVAPLVIVPSVLDGRGNATLAVGVPPGIGGQQLNVQGIAIEAVLAASRGAETVLR
jgi:hypothetical protein